MNSEAITEDQCIIDGTPLSENEITLIRTMREFGFFYNLDKLEKQFSAESVNEDNIWKPSYLSWSDVLMQLCDDMTNTVGHDVAKAIEILKMNDNRIKNL